MKSNRVLKLLIVTLSVMTVIPLVASLVFLDLSLEKTLNIGFNSEVKESLVKSSENLKALKGYNPESEQDYKSQFLNLQKLIRIYDDSQLVRNTIEDSIKVYFVLGVVLALGLALLIAVLLSRKINSTYRLAFDSYLKEQEKVKYLEEMSSWQELAKMLAHEIKNPLTPIEIMVSSLSKSFASKSEADFKDQLEKTEGIVEEELSHLKAIVDRFSEFSKLPRVEREPVDLAQCLENYSEYFRSYFESHDIQLKAEISNRKVLLDKALFRQVLFNLIKNGAEANDGQSLKFEIRAKSVDHRVEIQVSNSGKPIPRDMVKKIFDPYFSTKGGKANMGLGLTIVKKIVVEHEGDIQYAESEGRPIFVISIPEAVNG